MFHDLNQPLKWNVRYFDVVDSTNTVAYDLVMNHAALEGTVVVSKEQTHGRGQHGRRWESCLGNLLCTIILKESIPLEERLMLGFHMAQSVKNTLNRLFPHIDITKKWPNDLFIDGAKCAGFLVETHPECVLVGMGINIHVAPTIPDYLTTCLAQYVTTPPTPENLLEEILRDQPFMYL